ncbi:MAG: enoyl-CoA hydratase [Acidimicrobiales bacterium]|nr:MAG: enoyl-CoA hydratase [Acidimicrobiales bacterium]
MESGDVVVHVEVSDGVGLVRLDDGKANVLSHASLGQIEQALRDLRESVSALVIGGREGILSGGFDLKVMTAGPREARDLVIRGARLLLDLYTFPVPVVAACTGHAIAAGAMLLFVADERIGAEGEFRIGLNEVAAGMPMPRFGMELARDRLVPPEVPRAVCDARIYAPAEAVHAGFLDETAPPDRVWAVALERARELAGSLRQPAYRITKERLRGDRSDALKAELESDVGALTGT